MDNSRRILVISCEACILLGIILAQYQLLLLEIPVILIRCHMAMEGNGSSKKEVLLSAKELYMKIRSGRRLVHALIEPSVKTTVSEQLRLLARRQRLGAMDLTAIKETGKGPVDELTELVSVGLGAGRSIEKNLELFTERLEHQMKAENRFNSKAGGMQVLTYLGLVLFLPLFGGVSSAIIGLSSSAISQSSYFLHWRFLAIIGLYIAIALYINSAFRRPENSPMENLYVVMPFLTLAISILLLSAGFIVNII